jgi:integrase
MPTESSLTPRLADDFIRDLRARSGKDADSTCLVVSACSSFFSFLERRFDEIRNPFRGSRARPASTWTEAVIPTARELNVLQATAEPSLAAALAVAIETGLLVGELPGLNVREDGTWHAVSKAHRLHSAEPLSGDVCNALKAARLDSRRPFAPESFPRGPILVDGATKGGAEELLIAWLKMRLARLCAQLMLERKLNAMYSWHDLRHASAERNADRGLVWLRDRLGHSSVSLTERYLRNVLGVDTGKM